MRQWVVLSWWDQKHNLFNRTKQCQTPPACLMATSGSCVGNTRTITLLQGRSWKTLPGCFTVSFLYICAIIPERLAERQWGKAKTERNGVTSRKFICCVFFNYSLQTMKKVQRVFHLPTQCNVVLRCHRTWHSLISFAGKRWLFFSLESSAYARLLPWVASLKWMSGTFFLCITFICPNTT